VWSVGFSVPLLMNCAVARMIWLIVVISINGGPPQIIEKIPYEDMQGCQAEKAMRDSRQAHFVVPNGASSIKRKVFCTYDPAGATFEGFAMRYTTVVPA
jgi:hypothetical protein